jgi:hypothetical protein
VATIDIAFSDYVRNVRCSAQTTAVLAARLQKAAPHDISAELRAALRAIAVRAADVAEVQSERDRLGPARVRPLLSAYDNGWSALHEALVAAARIPAVVSNRGQRSRAILESVFPDGISFVVLDAEAAWAEGKRRVDRLRDEGFEATLAELIGSDFVATVDTVTKDLADAIGTGSRPHVVLNTSALQEALWRFGRAVGNYGRLMAATCDQESAASVERFLRAMAPIDAHRNAARSGGDHEADRDDAAPPMSPTSEVVAPSPTID